MGLQWKEKENLFVGGSSQWEHCVLFIDNVHVVMAKSYSSPLARAALGNTPIPWSHDAIKTELEMEDDHLTRRTHSKYQDRYRGHAKTWR
jgi:hypothetical protein